MYVPAVTLGAGKASHPPSHDPSLLRCGSQSLDRSTSIEWRPRENRRGIETVRGWRKISELSHSELRPLSQLKACPARIEPRRATCRTVGNDSRPPVRLRYADLSVRICVISASVPGFASGGRQATKNAYVTKFRWGFGLSIPTRHTARLAPGCISDASNTATIPTRNTPSNVPAPPIDATGAPSP